jgi:protein-tyrosine phosphatase
MQSDIDLTLDFHSHILPGCDHGSDSVKTSLKQIEMAKSAGIKTICATPHFYPHHENVDTFLKRRKQCFDRLKAVLPADAPEIYLGAEVLICDRLDSMDGLEKLCLEGTNLLLLEMPFSSWPDSIWDTLYMLLERDDIHVVMAHVDRYPADNIESLIKDGVKMQINAESLMHTLKRRRLLKWIECGNVQYIGSDIHMLGDNYEYFEKSRRLIEKKFM